MIGARNREFTRLYNRQDFAQAVAMIYAPTAVLVPQSGDRLVPHEDIEEYFRSNFWRNRDLMLTPLSVVGSHDGQVIHEVGRADSTLMGARVYYTRWIRTKPTEGSLRYNTDWQSVLSLWRIEAHVFTMVDVIPPMVDVIHSSSGLKNSTELVI